MEVIYNMKHSTIKKEIIDAFVYVLVPEYPKQLFITLISLLMTLYFINF